MFDSSDTIGLHLSNKNNFSVWIVDYESIATQFAENRLCDVAQLYVIQYNLYWYIMHWLFQYVF